MSSVSVTVVKCIRDTDQAAVAEKHTHVLACHMFSSIPHTVTL